MTFHSRSSICWRKADGAPGWDAVPESRKATRPRPEPERWPGLDRRADDSGPYVVDVTDEVARRASQEVVDTRPTMPFDTRSLL